MLLKYYYILIIFLLLCYLLLCYLLLCYFFRKKVTKKLEVFAMPLCARDVSLHNILSCADYISPTHIFLSFDHTQSPPIVFKYYFSFILFYFMVFFTDPPWLFRQRPLIPCIFLFFAFQRQEVFLSPLAKSTKAQYSCGSHIDMFRCSNNI